MRHFFRCLFLISAIAFCQPLAYAQENSIYFDKLDIKSGLPHMTIYDINQDRLGYIWIGTENGLARYDGYHFKTYRLGTDATNPDGANLISHLEFDKKGVLWVNTKSNGLFRYNIETDSFKQYNYPENESKVIYMTSLVDKDNNLWGYTTLYAHTRIANAWKFDIKTGKFELFGAREKGNNFINITYCTAVLQSSDGNIWACTDNGLYRYQGPDRPWQGYLVSQDTLSMNHIRCAYEAPSEPDILWISTYTDKNQKETTLLRFDIKANTFKKFATKAGSPDLPCFINNMYEDKKARLWMATDFGLTRLDRKTGKFTNYGLYDANNVMKRTITEYFVPGPKGDFWLNEKYGELLYFNPEEGILKKYDTNETTPGLIFDYRVTCKTVDYTNTLWVGTPYKGVKKTNRLKGLFTVYRNGAGSAGAAPSYTDGLIYPAQKGGFSWFLDSKHIYKWLEKENRFTIYYTFAEGEGPWSTAMTSDGDIYIGTTNGLIFYNKRTGKKERLTFENRAPGKNYDFYPNYYPDSQGILWLYTNNQGICTFDTATRTFTAYPYRAADENTTPKNAGYLDGEVVTSVYEDSRNTIWIGTKTGGLNKFDRKTGKFRSYLTPQNKKMYSISSMFEDRSGRLWLGTNFTGIFEFDRNRGTFIRNISETSGLVFNSVGGIQEDSSGHIWVKTKKGLSRIDPVTYKVHNFNTENILPGDEIVSGDLVKLRNGSFALYLKEGIAVFNPDIVTNNPYPPKVNLENIVHSDVTDKNGKPVNVPAYTLKSISLPYNRNTIQFNYIGLHYDIPSENTYSYKLEGFDNKWVMAGDRRNVTYNNLSPGTYIFYIKAASPDGVWSKPLKAITVTIAPPWWSTWWAYVLYAAIFAGMLRLYILYRSRSLRSKNAELEQKVSLRTNELEQSLAELKQTQDQLVQSEKMASLGELTAGIAHEIQNPLNFVNNFSDVSIELLDEMEEELDNGEIGEAKAIAGDLKQNLEKIAHHGRRADGIVKGMLQHSRASTGQKEPTDLNRLADEYLRLAYHGLRAKDKSFNAELVTHFDEDLPKVNAIPQDMGRVLLNLFNNAFYATQQKQLQSADGNYKPMVEVVTRRKGNTVDIIVKDNGTGITDAIKDKILQPFFTTKPTGEGTGLGLSLSYDIVVKGHGGSIAIESTEGEGAEFKLTLPV